jgi:AbiV family abortive infection protein
MKIPRAKMQEGIDLCKKNIHNFLDSAEILNQAHKTLHAFILAEFALEEFGKIQILKKGFEKSVADPIEVNRHDFIDHSEKEKEAWKQLDPKYSIIKVGGFEEGFEGKHGIGFEKETKTGHSTRIDVAFVDFDEDLGVWHIGREIDSLLLQNLIEHLRQKC